MIKITLYASINFYSKVDTKYTFNYEEGKISEGKKEFIQFDKKEIQKEKLNNTDIAAIKRELENYYIQCKIEDALKQNKKTITVSSWKNASKQFKDLLIKNSFKLDKELQEVKQEILKDIEFNGLTLDHYRNLQRRIEKSEYIKNNITIEEYKTLDDKLNKAQVVRNEYDYKYEKLIKIKQDENTNIFYFFNHGGINRYFYLITDRRNKTKKIIDLMASLLKLEGYTIDSEENIKYIDCYTNKYDRDLELTRDELEEIERLGNTICKRKYEYIAIYKEENEKLKKIV